MTALISQLTATLSLQSDDCLRACRRGPTFTVCVVIAEGLPSWFVATSPPAGSSPMRTISDVTLEGELKSGKYGVVRSLLRVLEGGTASKALLDSVIDACK